MVAACCSYSVTPRSTLGPCVSELRINYGLGYRVYYLKRGTALIILLASGDKSSQAKDIDEALLLADNLTEET